MKPWLLAMTAAGGAMEIFGVLLVAEHLSPIPLVQRWRALRRLPRRTLARARSRWRWLRHETRWLWDRALDRLPRRTIKRVRVGPATVTLSALPPTVVLATPTTEQRGATLEHRIEQLRGKRDPLPGVVLIIAGAVPLTVSSALSIGIS